MLKLKRRQAPPASLPVAVLGGGPVGLAAAAHLADRGRSFVLFEAGPSVASHVESWRHVRVFSPWEYNVDPTAAKLLQRHGWTAPPAEVLPTGGELVDLYLRPLAELPELAPHLRFGSRAVGVSRRGAGRLGTEDRDALPFVVRVQGPDGVYDVEAQAVIDATGTWSRPNPAGADGLPAIGELEAGPRIDVGIPDVLGSRRQDFAGRRVAVVGAGHSAVQSILALLDLRQQSRDAAGAEPGILWILRRRNLDAVFGGGASDALPARGALGTRLKEAVDAGRLTLQQPFFIERIDTDDGGLAIHGRTDTSRRMVRADRLIVATGSRPDLSFLDELRLELDPIVQAPRYLAPKIDPNLHSCGTVPPHGVKELRHPESGFFIVGSKAYGRAPTFLLRTGYEQVRSVVAELDGDLRAARRVELVLPATGVCKADAAPAPAGNAKAAPAACCGGAC